MSRIRMDVRCVPCLSGSAAVLGLVRHVDRCGEWNENACLIIGALWSRLFTALEAGSRSCSYPGVPAQDVAWHEDLSTKKPITSLSWLSLITTYGSLGPAYT